MNILRNKELLLKLLIEAGILLLLLFLFALPGLALDIASALEKVSGLSGVVEGMETFGSHLDSGLSKVHVTTWIVLLGASYILLDYVFAKIRYRKLERLSQSVDEILHGSSEVILSISDYEEGEFSILASEIRKLTVRLKEQTDSLQKDKITLSDAIADIFHQLRTPLTALNLSADLLREENLSVERRIMLTRDVKKQLERIQWLVETLLKLSKIDASTAVFEEKPIFVGELFTKATAPFEIPLELRDIRLKTKVSADASFIGDFYWSVEAISNLIKNCMEHTPAGGTISLHAEENALFTEIIISDTGEGFAQEDIPHLFQRFYKGKNASPNSIGIGLALCRSIIIAQSGTITAKNWEEGAQFVIRFYKTVV